MSKPRKQVVDYFPHTVNHKKTMHILESQWGNDGYAFWFKLLELLGKTEGHYYNCNKADEWYYLLSYTKVSKETALEILNRLAELEAIDPGLWKQKYIWSQNFVDGVAGVYKKRLRDIPIQPVIRHRKPVCNGVNDARNPQSKVKESKVKESKDTNAQKLLQYYKKLTGKKRVSKVPGEVNERLDEGHTVDEGKKVILYKYLEWWNTPKMRSAVNLTTLFRPCHFEEYLSQAEQGLTQMQQEAYDNYKQIILKQYQDTGEKQEIIPFEEWCDGEGEVS